VGRAIEIESGVIHITYSRVIKGGKEELELELSIERAAAAFERDVCGKRARELQTMKRAEDMSWSSSEG